MHTVGHWQPVWIDERNRCKNKVWKIPRRHEAYVYLKSNAPVNVISYIKFERIAQSHNGVFSRKSDCVQNIWALCSVK